MCETVSLGTFDLLGSVKQPEVIGGKEAQATGATSLGTFNLDLGGASGSFKLTDDAGALPEESYPHEFSADPPIVVPCSALPSGQC
jgi:hypothetical protein